MKGLFTILFLFIISVAICQSRSLSDKYLHFGAGYIISSATSAFGYHVNINKHISIGITAGISAGLIKELRDQFVYQGFDPVDLVVTSQGSLFGGTCVKIFFVPQVQSKNPIEF